MHAYTFEVRKSSGFPSTHCGESLGLRTRAIVGVTISHVIGRPQFYFALSLHRADGGHLGLLGRRGYKCKKWTNCNATIGNFVPKIA